MVRANDIQRRTGVENKSAIVGLYFIAIAVFMLSAVTSYAENIASTELRQMTMTLPAKHDVRILIAGTGIATINWGDGSSSTHTISPENPSMSHRHKYSNTAATHTYTITIIGENITYLDCSYMGLTSLDISKNAALKNLECYHNNLTNLDVSKY